MTHDEPGPGQTYAIQARQAIAILRIQEPAIEIEIRWCPAHKGIPGNEVADKWTKLAASEPDDHGGGMADARRRNTGGAASGKEVAGSTVMVGAEEPE